MKKKRLLIYLVGVLIGGVVAYGVIDSDFARRYIRPTTSLPCASTPEEVVGVPNSSSERYCVIADTNPEDPDEYNAFMPVLNDVESCRRLRAALNRDTAGFGEGPLAVYFSERRKFEGYGDAFVLYGYHASYHVEVIDGVIQWARIDRWILDLSREQRGKEMCSLIVFCRHINPPSYRIFGPESNPPVERFSMCSDVGQGRFFGANGTLDDCSVGCYYPRVDTTPGWKAPDQPLESFCPAWKTAALAKQLVDEIKKGEGTSPEQLELAQKALEAARVEEGKYNPISNEERAKLGPATPPPTTWWKTKTGSKGD